MFLWIDLPWSVQHHLLFIFPSTPLHLSTKKSNWMSTCVWTKYMKLSVYLQIFSTDWHCPSKVMIILTMRHPCTVLFLDKLLLYTANIRSTMMLNSAISDKPWKWICSSLSRKGAIFMAGKWRETLRVAHEHVEYVVLFASSTGKSHKFIPIRIVVNGQ